MNLGAKVQQLECKQNSIDDAVRDLMKVVSGTHEVVGMILKEQLELRKEQMELRKELVEMKALQNVRYEEQSKHNIRVEDILIQIINRLPDQPTT